MPDLIVVAMKNANYPGAPVYRVAQIRGFTLAHHTSQTSQEPNAKSKNIDWIKARRPVSIYHLTH